LAAKPLRLAAIAESDAAPDPSRWWWLVILAGSLSGWAVVICLTVFLGRALAVL
jgi:hypothetical protein